MTEKYPDNQRTSLLRELESRLSATIEDNSITYNQAFNRVALSLLGYDSDLGTMSDGRGDHGVDYWEVHSDRVTVFQFKSHDYSEVFNENYKITPSHLAELRHIKELFENLNEAPPTANKSIKDLFHNLHEAIRNIKVLSESVEVIDEEDEGFYEVEIIFCGLGIEFTEQAQQEYKDISNTTSIEYDGLLLNLTYKCYLIDDLLEQQWKESNTTWKDSSGRKRDRIKIETSGKDQHYIRGHNYAVFFGRAVDLVKAFSNLGYQIFEPNVRCELTRSKINKEIKNSLETKKGREQFKHFNNGITIVCESYSTPKPNKSYFDILKPGIVNGLQTVKSLFDGYHDMDLATKNEFDSQCEVLIRLHARGSVENVNALIRATNNQNPMHPRNLRSNEAEQIQLQKLFAQAGWFYERKEQEWRAFISKTSLNAWPHLGGKRKQDFVTDTTRKVDNLEVAQAYFAFLGYATEAMNKKKQIFSDEAIYGILFRLTPTKHGFNYQNTFLKNKSTICGDSDDCPPPFEALLIALLSRRAAKEFSIDQRSARKYAIERMRLENKSKEQQDILLFADLKFIVDYVLRGTEFLFPEFVGFVLYSAWGHDIGHACREFSKNHSMSRAFNEFDFSDAKEKIQDNKYHINDLLVVLWLLYKEIIEDIVNTPSWRGQWNAASNRSGFHYSEETRREISKRFNEYEKLAERRGLNKAWSAGGIDKEKGIIKYVQKILA